MKSRDLIYSAFRLALGARDDVETFSANHAENGLFALNAMVKSWQAEGISLWKDTEVTVPTVAGQEAYATARYLRISNVRRRDANDIEVTMGYEGTPMSRAEYMRIPAKEAEGTPNQAYYWPSVSAGNLYLWPSPLTAEWDIVFTARTAFSDFTLTGDVDFPGEWIDALRYNLAVNLALEYPTKGGLNPLVVQRAAELKELLKGFDIDPGPTYFAPAPDWSQ